MKSIIKKINKERKLIERYKENIEVGEDFIQHCYHELEDKVKLEDLRPAQPKDIMLGQLIFINGGYDWYCRHIEEVLNPEDEWKGYYLEQCRHGLYGAYVLREDL